MLYLEKNDEVCTFNTTDVHLREKVRQQMLAAKKHFSFFAAWACWLKSSNAACTGVSNFTLLRYARNTIFWWCRGLQTFACLCTVSTMSKVLV